MFTASPHVPTGTSARALCVMVATLNRFSFAAGQQLDYSLRKMLLA